MNPIFYKEWIKTRLYLGLLAIVNLAFAVYAVLRLRYIYGQYDAVAVWGAWLYDAFAFYRVYQYIPLVSGLVLAAAQFLPEVRDRRLRLVLHLPVEEKLMIGQHIAYGAAALALTALPAALILGIASARWFPGEFLRGLVLTMMPWLLAGLAAYLLASAVLIEGRWSRRILLAVVGAGALRLFYHELSIGSYARIWPWFALWTLAALCLPILSSERFRRGL